MRARRGGGGADDEPGAGEFRQVIGLTMMSAMTRSPRAQGGPTSLSTTASASLNLLLRQLIRHRHKVSGND